jgi:hypothetical protein
MPVKLIERIARHRLKEVAEKATPKKKISRPSRPS